MSGYDLSGLILTGKSLAIALNCADMHADVEGVPECRDQIAARWGRYEAESAPLLAQRQRELDGLAADVEASERVARRAKMLRRVFLVVFVVLFALSQFVLAPLAKNAIAAIDFDLDAYNRYTMLNSVVAVASLVFLLLYLVFLVRSVIAGRQLAKAQKANRTAYAVACEELRGIGSACLSDIDTLLDQIDVLFLASLPDTQRARVLARRQAQRRERERSDSLRRQNEELLRSQQETLEVQRRLLEIEERRERERTNR